MLFSYLSSAWYEKIALTAAITLEFFSNLIFPQPPLYTYMTLFVYYFFRYSSLRCLNLWFQAHHTDGPCPNSNGPCPSTTRPRPNTNGPSPNTNGPCPKIDGLCPKIYWPCSNTSGPCSSDDGSCPNNDNGPHHSNDDGPCPDNGGGLQPNNDNQASPKIDDRPCPNNDYGPRPNNYDRPCSNKDDRPPPNSGEGPRPKNDYVPRPNNGEGRHPKNGEGRHPKNDEGPRPKNGEGPRPKNGEGPRSKNGEGPHPKNYDGPHPNLLCRNSSSRQNGSCAITLTALNSRPYLLQNSVKPIKANHVCQYTYRVCYHVSVCLLLRLSNDIEENPGPVNIAEIVDPRYTVRADFSQGNQSLFGLNAGKQCVAMSI